MALPPLPALGDDWATWGTAVHNTVNGAAVVADIGTPGTATGDALSAAFVAASSVEGVKVHDGTTGGGTRPTGYARVRWVGGTARPTNMVAGDIWEHDA